MIGFWFLDQEDSCQGRFQMNFLLIWRLPPSYWKTEWIFFALLESTTVLLEDSIFREDTRWIFLLSWWVPLSSVADSVFHKKFLQFFLCYQFLLHQSSHVIFWSPVKLRLYNSKRNCKIEDLDRVLFEWTSSKESWRNATLTI